MGGRNRIDPSNASIEPEWHSAETHLELSTGKLFNVVFKHKIYCVIHFAGLKAVGESVQFPLLYYEKNVVSAINILQCMKDHNCKNLIFSSSCTVYGSPHKLPITESTPVGKCTCAYGRTKYFIEQIVQDHCAANQVSSIAGLRMIKHLILTQTLPDFRC